MNDVLQMSQDCSYSLKTGMSAFDVCKAIVATYPDVAYLQLVSHPVMLNWRQQHSSQKDRRSNLLQSFAYHEGSNAVMTLNRHQFLSFDLPAAARSLRRHQVLSISSKVRLKNKVVMHIPMMNYHLENGMQLSDLIRTTNFICGKREGAILASGRYYHYYGNYLISEKIWRQFVAAFLIPCVIVSPGYVGHRLLDGYCTLRLTTEPTYKHFMPKVIKIIGGRKRGLIDDLG